MRISGIKIKIKLYAFFAAAMLLTLGSAWESVHAQNYTIKYSGNEYVNSMMWNTHISNYVNKKPLYVYIDSQSVSGDFYMNRDMELMVPVKTISDCFDCAKNIYNGNEIILQKKDTVLKFYMDNPNIYFVNDEQKEFQSAVEVVEGNAYVASSIITENFGYEYYWDVTINSADFATVWQDSSLPSYYSLRDTGRQSVVKNQGRHSTCWAVAALSALETTLLPEESYVFAAEHMALKNSFTRNIDDGGEYTMSMAYLLSWQGPVLEEEDAYGDLVSPDDLTPAKHIQEIQLINNKNIEKIKDAVFKKGAVQTSIYTSLKSSTSRSKYYNRENNAYYYSEEREPNHEIIIIGWDDNYPKENFSIQPENNGAFICQNSWGTNFGDNGVFYVSYEDKQIGKQSVVYSGIENNNNYDNIYQTDLCGWSGQIGFGKENCYFANVFTANDTEIVQAVGFYATDENTAYEIYKANYFQNVNSLGEEELIASGSFENAGFYTVDLNKKFQVDEGERFAIIIRIYTPNAVHPVVVEYAVKDRCENVDLSDGEGYISSDGKNWINVENNYNCNVCMKIYTDNIR